MTNFYSFLLFLFSPLKPSGRYMSHCFENQRASFCICGFCIILNINSDYFLKQHEPVGLCFDEDLYFLRGMDCFLNIILTISGFKRLIAWVVNWSCYVCLQNPEMKCDFFFAVFRIQVVTYLNQHSAAEQGNKGNVAS